MLTRIACILLACSLTGCFPIFPSKSIVPLPVSSTVKPPAAATDLTPPVLTINP